MQLSKEGPANCSSAKWRKVRQRPQNQTSTLGNRQAVGQPGSFCKSRLKLGQVLAFRNSHLLPERRPCGKSMQLKLITLQVEQGQVETFNLDQHLLVIRPCPLGLCSWCRTTALRDGALRASNHADINDLPRSLDSDNLKLAQAVLKLGRNVGSRCFSETVIKKQLAAGLFSPFSFPLLPSLVHGEVVVVNVRVVTLKLVQLDVDDPLFVSLRHEPSVLVLTLFVDSPFPPQLLALLQHFSIEQGISSRIIGELFVIAEKTIIVLNPATLVAIVPRPAVFQDAQGVHMAWHQIPPGSLLKVAVLLETLVKAILVISPWLLSVLVVVPIVVPLLLVTSTVVASIVELIASTVVELVFIVVTMVVLVIKPAMILVMAMIPSLADLVVSLTHLPLFHVVVVSLLCHFHVVISLVLGVHIVVPLVHLPLLLDHLGALTELWRRLVEILRML